MTKLSSEKLIRVINDDFTELDTYLSNGWKIKTLSSCRIDSRLYESSVCYVAISLE